MFNLENIEALLEQLHILARSCTNERAIIYFDAIDAIEQLSQMNKCLVEQNKELGESYKIIANLKAERDAAVNDLKIADKNCRFCLWYDKTYQRGKYCTNDESCDFAENDHWTWRGAKKNETD